MNFWTFLATVISSTLISTIVGSLLNHYSLIRLKRIEFDYDYKKYILEKRKKAYEQLEILLPTLFEQFFYTDKQQQVQTIHGIYFIKDSSSKNNPVEISIQNLSLFDNYSFWYTDKIVQMLLQFSLFLQEENKLAKQPFNQDVLTLQAKKSFAKIESYRENIYKQYFKDIQGLDDIHNFKEIKTTTKVSSTEINKR